MGGDSFYPRAVWARRVSGRLVGPAANLTTGHELFIQDLKGQALCLPASILQPEPI